MQLPELYATPQRTLNTTSFLGYNHTNQLSDGEMYDMRNMSSRSYPLLDQRPKRTEMLHAGSGTYHGVAGREKLVVIRGKKVYYNNEEVVGLSLSENSRYLPKRIVSMGAYVCIWPDKVYFNTANPTDCGTMFRMVMMNTPGTVISMCRLDGTDYDMTEIEVSDTAPADPQSGDMWIDTSGAKHILKQYSSTGEWTEIATTYIKIARSGIGTALSVYDGINIKGLSYVEDGVADPQVEELNGDKILYGVGDNYIIIAGIIDHTVTFDSEHDVDYYVNRTVPDLDYVCESNNRIWGCRYGMVNGEFVNEIRACKLGDFKNWNVFMGLSTDSYVVSVGTDGPFSGAASQRGYPVFFKENCVHRITGSAPSSYSTSVIGVRGIQEGSWRSAVVIDENIFYKATDGVYYFDGSMAYKISDQLGDVMYRDARAGELHGKYYISMQNTNSEWNLFAYDTRLRMWHREDELQALGFGTVNGELYAIDEGEDKIWMLTGDNPDGWECQAEDDFEWQATFGLFGTDYTNQKYLSRFNLRMQMDEEAEARLLIMYDQDGVWHEQGKIRGRSTRTFMLPVIPRRCDHLQIRLEGKGRCRLYSMSRVLEVGGDG